MIPRRLLPGVLLALAACVPGGAGDGAAPTDSGLQPSFEPAPTATGTQATTGTAAPDAEPSPTATAPPPTGEPAGGEPPAATSPAPPETSPDQTDGTGTASPEPSPTMRAGLSDASGDVEPGRPAQDPPDHADLVGADLARAPDRFVLRVDLRGGAPQQPRDDDHTLNVAAFYDVDGDGQVDYETWANLQSGGWGTSWFDNREGEARFADEDDVEVAVKSGRLVLRFPHGHVGDATRFRWSLATEWGTFEDLRLGTTARDFAPDDGRPTAFPDEG